MLKMWLRGVLALLILSTLVLGQNPSLEAASPAHSGTRYFVMVFGSESVPKRPRFTHTWATIVKAVPAAGNPSSYQIESQTISWMPRTLRIRPLALRAECGVNLSLAATLHDCFCKGECVAMWGPYEFDSKLAPEVYDRTAAQIARLNSGCVLYKCIDPDQGARSTYISNCIHAVTDLDRQLPRPSYNEFQNYGMDASRYLVRVLESRNRFDVNVTHPWVAEAMGVDQRVQRQTLKPSR